MGSGGCRSMSRAVFAIMLGLSRWLYDYELRMNRMRDGVSIKLKHTFRWSGSDTYMCSQSYPQSRLMQCFQFIEGHHDLNRSVTFARA